LHRDLSALNEVDHISLCDLNHGVMLVGRDVLNNREHSVKITNNFRENQLPDVPSGEQVVHSAIHEMGIPEVNNHLPRTHSVSSQLHVHDT
jgi:hypothetical protein